MKTIRYILFVLAVFVTTVSMPLHAQGYGNGMVQDPAMVTFQSTSMLPSSGSALPSAVRSGVKMAGNGEAAAPDGAAYAPGMGDDWEKEDWGTGAKDPWENPIGDAPYLLLLILAAAYLAYLTLHRQRARRA